MKKLLSSLALGATLVSTVANADFIRVEAGAGAWMQTPNGYATRHDNDGALKLDGTYTSAEKENSGVYAWILVKHPIPIVPNLRLEYVSFSDKGTTTGKVNGIGVGSNGAPTTMDIQQFDIVPYYNLLDNTFWMTIDVGIDAKVMISDVTVASTGILFNGYQSTDTSVIPLLYLRDRVQIPTTNIGIEADAKAITDGTNTMYDVRAKVDYTFDSVPVIQPAIELGYRMQKLRVDDGDKTDIDLTYQGPYVGVMARF